MLPVFLALLAVEAPLRTVPNVDLEKYAGKWYEIARLPNRFQKHCVSDVTAIYTLNDDKTVTVLNTCMQVNGREKSAEGVARVAEDAGGSNAVLDVRFAPSFLSFLPFVWGDYRIIALGPAYEYAVVGTEDRKYLWILSREKIMPEELYRKLLAEAAAQGFDTGPVLPTKHN